MKSKMCIRDRIIKALASFTVSYAFVVIAYVVISSMGVFDPIDNEMAFQLLGTCFVTGVIHFAMGFLNIRSNICFLLLYFGTVVAVVFFMGLVVYDYFLMNVTFFVCLAAMLVVVFVGTYLIAYYDDWKKVQEINQIIQKNKQ
ncbi:MAG: hypothetical protein K2N73_18425 [Lachnospiraceae bacterium]|nr:hypothetical protein [Lachnospiraceae bacterium]